MIGLIFFKQITQLFHQLALSLGGKRDCFIWVFCGTQAIWPVGLRNRLALAFYSRSGVSTELIDYFKLIYKKKVFLYEIDKDLVFNMQVVKCNNFSRVVCSDNIVSVAYEIDHCIYLLLFSIGYHCSCQCICIRCYIWQKRKVQISLKENCQIIDDTVHGSLS